MRRIGKTISKLRIKTGSRIMKKFLFIEFITTTYEAVRWTAITFPQLSTRKIVFSFTQTLSLARKPSKPLIQSVF